MGGKRTDVTKLLYSFIEGKVVPLYCDANFHVAKKKPGRGGLLWDKNITCLQIVPILYLKKNWCRFLFMYKSF